MSKHLSKDDFVQVPRKVHEPVSYVPYVPGTEILPRVSSSTLVKLAISLTHSSLIDQDSCTPQPETRLSTPINSLNFEQFKTCNVVKNMFSFTPIDCKKIESTKPLADERNIVSSIVESGENQQQLARRLSLSQLNIAGVSGDYLIIAEGKTLKSFHITNNSTKTVSLKFVSSISIPAPALSIALSPLDPNIIAVATLRRALIYTLNPGDGTFSLMNEIELMLDTLGPNIFLNSVHWIPLAPLHVAVV